MNSTLKLIETNGQYLIDSRDVAEYIDKRHDHLLRDIKKYIDVISTNPNLGALDFFVPSTYQDNKGQVRPHYLLTKKGCEMVANKMTGEKGVLFTAEYVTRFNEMEHYLQTGYSQLSPQLQHMIRLEQKQNEQDKRLGRLEDNLSIDSFQQKCYPKAN